MSDLSDLARKRGSLLFCTGTGVCQLGTVKASIAITIVSSISFFGFLIGPPVIGWLSEVSGLRMAISIAACLGLMIAFVATKVSKRISIDTDSRANAF